MSTDIRIGDCRSVLASLDAESVQCCVTSPPYFGLRDYGVVGQIGLEATPDAYVAELVMVFREVRRVLKNDGTLWLNLGDSYASTGGERSYGSSDGGTGRGPGARRFRRTTDAARRDDLGACRTEGDEIPDGSCGDSTALRAKNLLGIPWRVAFALQADGWYLRSDIIWHKPNPMPESVTDRPTKAHEYLFLLAKSERYYYDSTAIAEECEKGAAGSTFNTGKTATHQLGRASAVARIESETRNRRTVWTVATTPYSGAHFATFPPALIEPCILAGSRIGDTVLDPFGGAGTTGLVADRLNRHALLIELNPAYADLARNRIVDDNPLFSEVAS